LTAEEAIAKKEANQLKRQAIVDKKNAYLVRTTRNKIKNEHKACGIAARKLERERKKRVELLQKAKEFIPVELLKPIPDPELSVTEADIQLQLRERLISNPAALGLNIDSLLSRAQTSSSSNAGGGEDFISFLGLGISNIKEDNFME
jgi:hypothetical protein